MGRSPTTSHPDSSTALKFSRSPAMTDVDSSDSGSLLLTESGPFPVITEQERDSSQEPLEGLAKNQIPIGTLTPSGNLSPESENEGSEKNKVLLQELSQSETNLSTAQAELHSTQSELEQLRREMEDLHSAQQDNQVLIQQLQSELDSALKQIGQQDLDKQNREANWRATEDQLIQQNELSKSQLEQNQQELALSITEIASLQEKIATLQAECQSQQNLLAQMEETKTALELNTARLAATEKQLEEQLRSVDQRDQQIEEQRKQIETHTQELEQLTHDHQLDSQRREQELQVIHLEAIQKGEGLDQAEKRIEAREAELSAATQALQKDREQITLDQQAVEQKTRRRKKGNCLNCANDSRRPRQNSRRPRQNSGQSKNNLSSGRQILTSRQPNWLHNAKHSNKKRIKPRNACGNPPFSWNNAKPSCTSSRPTTLNQPAHPIWKGNNCFHFRNNSTRNGPN